MNQTITFIVAQTARTIFNQQSMDLVTLQFHLLRMVDQVIAAVPHSPHQEFHSCEDDMSSSMAKSEYVDNQHIVSETNSKGSSMPPQPQTTVKNKFKFPEQSFQEESEIIFKCQEHERDEYIIQMVALGKTLIQLSPSIRSVHQTESTRSYLIKLEQLDISYPVASTHQSELVLEVAQQEIKRLYNYIESSNDVHTTLDRIQSKLNQFDPNQPTHQLLHRDLTDDLLHLYKKLIQVFSDAPSTQIEHIFKNFLDSRSIQQQSQLLMTSLEQIHKSVNSIQQHQPVILPLSLYYSRDPHILNIRNQFRSKISSFELQHQKSFERFKFDLAKPLSMQPLVTKLFPYEPAIYINSVSSGHTLQFIITPRGMIGSLRKPISFQQSKSKYIDLVRQTLQPEEIINIYQLEEILSMKQLDSKQDISALIVKDIFIGSKAKNQYNQPLNDIVLPQDDQQSVAPIHARIQFQFRNQWLKDISFRLFLAGSFGRFPNLQEVKKLPSLIIRQIYKFLDETGSIYISDCGSKSGTYVQLSFDDHLKNSIMQQHLQVFKSGRKTLISLGPYSRVVDAISQLIQQGIKENDSINSQINKIFSQNEWKYTYHSQQYDSYIDKTYDFTQRACLVFLEAQDINIDAQNSQLHIISVRVYVYNDDASQRFGFADLDKLCHLLNTQIHDKNLIQYINIEGFGSVLQANLTSTQRFMFFESHKSTQQDAIWFCISPFKLDNQFYSSFKTKIYSMSKIKIGSNIMEIIVENKNIIYQ